MIRTKFKVGDKIRATGNQVETGYSITIDGWEGTVTEAEDACNMFYAIDKQNGDPAYQLDSQYFELIAIPIKSIYKPQKGMKNLAAAAKALSRTGPPKQYTVTINGEYPVTAHDDEEAREEIRNLISNGLKVESMDNIGIGNPITMPF